MAMWNPWRGCKKCSDGCLHCYIHKGDSKRDINTNDIIKTKDFNKPIEKLKNGNYKIKPGIVYLCFSTDFLIEEADEWRDGCWDFIRRRDDCIFVLTTKRPERIKECVPEDWGEGWEHVYISISIENQQMADIRLKHFLEAPVKHREVFCAPLIGPMSIGFRYWFNKMC